MNAFISRMAGYALIVGLIIFGFQVWDLINSWNINRTPLELTPSAIADNGHARTYVRIKGGRLDIMNVYEEALEGKKSKVRFHTLYYIPVVNTDGSGSYILKNSLTPTLADLISELDMTGLLKDGSGLSSEMLAAFTKKYKFPGKLLVLDATYTPRSRWQLVKDLLLPLGLMVVSLLVRVALSGKLKASGTDGAGNTAAQST